MKQVINRLPEPVIAAIAAGEVIENPAQVVKELLENSLDAGAKHIKVALENGGLSKILVSDDGLGMSREDLAQCWQRHTTSKIKELKDLQRIRSLGFRGEALFSMASVAEVSIQSRLRGEKVGFCLEVKYGHEKELRPMGLPEGTTVIVKNLFAQVPARLKFLTDPQKEYRQVLHVFSKMAAGYPGVAMSLEKDGQLVLNLPAGELKQRVELLWGAEYESQMLGLELEEAPLKVSGFISRPQFARKSKKHQYLFINQRLVENLRLSEYIKGLLGDLLDDKSYPQLLLQLELPEQYLDVNIHPQKASVEFWDEAEVFKFIGQAITQALRSANLIFTYQEQQAQLELARSKKADAKTFGILKEEADHFDVRQLNEDEILQFHRTYLMYQRGNKLLLVDQHAAHEKILFEEFKQQFKERKLVSLKLDRPVVVKLGAEDVELLAKKSQEFEAVGFKWQPGAKQIKLTKVPELFAERDLAALIRELLDNIRENRSLEMDEKSLETLQFLSCRGAIKAGDYLSPAERKKLIIKLEASHELYTCPHGRPLKIELSLSELEKMFHRH